MVVEGFITGYSISGDNAYFTNRPYAEGVGVVLQSDTGMFITSDMTGQFQPLGSYVLTSDTGLFITSDVTGQFQNYWQQSDGYISPISGFGITGASGRFNSIIIGPSDIPSAIDSFGLSGQIIADAEYLYVCISDNRWKRTTLMDW